MSQPYPLMLRLDGRTCVVVGGGAVASRKVAGLIAAGASVTVISPLLHPELQSLAASGVITVRLSVYLSGALADLHPLLVFAATDNAIVNQQIAEEAHQLGALVDIADSGADSNMLSMSTLRRGPITIAVSTGGASPALAAHLHEKLDGFIGEEYTTLADWMAESRSHVRENIPNQTDRAALWQHILKSSILDQLRQGDQTAARQQFDYMIQTAVGDQSS